MERVGYGLEDGWSGRANVPVGIWRFVAIGWLVPEGGNFDIVRCR